MNKFDQMFEEFCSEMESIEIETEVNEEISLEDWLFLEKCASWENRLMEDGLI
jgi:hypothetical protein